MFEVIGPILIGLATGLRGFFWTNKGEKWMNKITEWVTEKCYTQDPHRSQQLLIQGLETLSPGWSNTDEEAILRKGGEGFDEVLEHIEEDPSLNPDLNFEPFDPTDEIVRLERVERDSDDYDALKRRGVADGRKYCLDAVMEDGSRKIIDDIG